MRGMTEGKIRNGRGGKARWLKSTMIFLNSVISHILPNTTLIGLKYYSWNNDCFKSLSYLLI